MASIIENKVLKCVGNKVLCTIEADELKYFIMMIYDDSIQFKDGLHAGEFVRDVLFFDPHYCVKWEQAFHSNLRYNKHNSKIYSLIKSFRFVINISN